MSTTPKFPHIEVTLTGSDGNAFAILGAVEGAMRRAGCTAEEIGTFHGEATSGDYDHLLQTCIATVSVS